MYQAPLPKEYADLSAEETAERIRKAKLDLGENLVILGHHYQRDEIIEHADFRGDSYKLCLDASSRPEARTIVFCGVHFMAESAAVLTDKRVLLPNMAAGCSMADMATLIQVRNCWRDLDQAIGVGGIIPVTYINSAANLKGFVGEHGGTVCTSTNAPVAVEWALNEGKKVLFFPDQHLGRNTGVKLGYDPDTDMVVWDPYKPLGGNTVETLRNAKFILWKGHCSVHARFAVDQIQKARATNPLVNVIVHPECPLDVVRASDLNGSTEYIIKKVTAAPAGTAWAIGTEINLVSRLAKENPDKEIACLDPQICPCSTMYRIHPSFLLWTLESLCVGEIRNEVKVAPNVTRFARQALDQMLKLAPSAAAV
jgi:quinolinate synthase